MTTARVSIVATVLNEYGSLPGWLDALAAQSTHPDQFIVVDGGSTDGTLEYLQSAHLPFSMVVLRSDGCSISQGRNIGIAASTGEIVVVTDAGTRAEPGWLERLTDPFSIDPDVDIVAGFFSAESNGLWGEALAAATLPDAVEIDASSFLASSRSVAFRRRWFEQGFAYPEWLDYCEDLVFDLRLRSAGARQSLVADAVVRTQPRSSPRAFFLQYFRYARGDGKAGLFFLRHAIRYATYVLAGVLVVRRRPWELGLAGVAGVLYMGKAVRRLLRRCWIGRPGRLALLTALAVSQTALGDIAKMAGYPAGLWWRYRRDRSLKFWKSGWRSRHPDGRLQRF